MIKDDVSGLKSLGAGNTQYARNNPSPAILETFPNAYPDSNYRVNFEFNEFTSLCPKTGQPDFAMVRITYLPDKKCVETKSLKLYFFAYRNEGSFMETICNRILNDLVEVTEPREATVTMEFAVRGGVALTVTARYSMSDRRIREQMERIAQAFETPEVGL